MKAVLFTLFDTKGVLKKFFVTTLIFSFLVTSFGASSVIAQSNDLEPLKNISKVASLSSQRTTPEVNLIPTNKTYQETLAPSNPTQSYSIQQTLWPLDQVGDRINEVGTDIKEFMDNINPAKPENIYKFITGIIDSLARLIFIIFYGPSTADCVITELQKGAQGNPYVCNISAGSSGGITNGVIYNQPTGIVALTASSIDQINQAAPQNITTQDYLAYINPFKTKDVYAQGIGRERLTETVLNLWSTLRNASYAFLVLILVIIGFMIMFRAKVDPRTTVGVLNSLPRIVLVLILITFSFPIGALAIDSIGLLLDLIGCGPINLYCAQTLPNPSGHDTQVFTKMSGGIIITALVAAFQVPIVPIVVSGLPLIILAIILLIGAFIIIARVGLAFVTEWVTLYFVIIGSPFFLLGGAFPGSSAIKGWFKRLLAPILCIVGMYTAVAIAGKFSPGLFGTTVSYPELQGLANTSGLGFSIPTFFPWPDSGFNAIVSLGIMLHVPALCSAIKKALDVALPTGDAINALEGERISRGARRGIGTAITPTTGGAGRPGRPPTGLVQRGVRAFGNVLGWGT